MSRDGWVALPRGAMGLSAVCGCGISWSYSLTIFDFGIVNFPYLDGNVPRSTSYGVHISQLIRFAKASIHVAYFNTRNKSLTHKLLKQGYRYHKLRKTFSKFYRWYYDLISKFEVGIKSLLRQGPTETEFYSDLVYKFETIVGCNNFSAQLIKTHFPL